jgi:hypothetical protein
VGPFLLSAICAECSEGIGLVHLGGGSADVTVGIIGIQYSKPRLSAVPTGCISLEILGFQPFLRSSFLADKKGMPSFIGISVALAKVQLKQSNKDTNRCVLISQSRQISCKSTRRRHRACTFGRRAFHLAGGWLGLDPWVRLPTGQMPCELHF